jgi:predicted dehydrogenase
MTACALRTHERARRMARGLLEKTSMKRNKQSAKVRYAVIGVGHISQVAVLPAFENARENSELAALISSDPKKLKVLGKRYDVPHLGSYDDIEELLSEGQVDAAYIAVPNAMHREVTERVVSQGVHVLCEKPMAMTSDDCEAMIRAAEENDVKLMIAYRLHFEKANLAAIERARKEEIGKPLIFSSVFCHQVREGDIRTQGELGGGALYDLGVYCVNAARHLFGAEPERVSAVQLVGTDERFPDVDATTTAILRFSEDRVAQFTACQGAADVAEYRVVGTKGDLRLDPAYEYAGELKEFRTIDGKSKEKTYRKRDQFAPELVYFAQCILEDREPEPSGEEGLADVRVLEAIARAAKSGKSVELAPFARRKRPSERQAMKKPPVRKPDTVHAPSPSK